MKIVVASGKGGVGKSMLASSLSLLYSKKQSVVACDCDVDAPNLGLWLGVEEYDSKKEISSSEKAEIINQTECDEKILEICKFNAIKKKDGSYFITPFLCEGCGACKVTHPQAVEIKPVKNAIIQTKKTKHGFPLVSAQLHPGETGSGKIVEELREKADAYERDMIIRDAAAGVGCPVIASIQGSDYAVLVTEPTPSGFADLQRILDTVNHFGIPYGVVVNKWDINPTIAEQIRTWSEERFLGQISYDKKVVESIVRLEPVLHSDSNVVKEIETIFEQLQKSIMQNK